MGIYGRLLIRLAIVGGMLGKLVWPRDGIPSVAKSVCRADGKA